MKLPGDNMVITIMIEDFEETSPTPVRLTRSMVLDITQMIDRGPEFKFGTIEYVVGRMMEEIKEVMVTSDDADANSKGSNRKVI